MSTAVGVATGRRKEAVARVHLSPGKGVITVNKRRFEEVFPVEALRLQIVTPFDVTQTMNQYDVTAHVKGGGSSGQAGALRHGIARALMTLNEALRPALKKADLIKRDPRMKERKKYGQKGARKRFQFTKR